MKNALILTGCILLTLLVGGLSGYLTIQGVATWYPALHKPFFNPPNTIFGPVWTFLYFLMGVSFFLVIKQPPSPARTRAIQIFILQLVANFLWSILFFNRHLIGIALADILIMLVLIYTMVVTFGRVSRLASLLQLPYLVWVSFATILNAAILYLN